VPEHALGAPEASHPHDELLVALREGGLERVAEDGVAVGERHLVTASRKGAVAIDH
jgi:hypothetical protein